jgi:hypothetical protein
MIRLRCRNSSSTERRQSHRRGTALFELIAYLVPLLSLALFGLAVVKVRGAESAASWRVHRDVNRLATDPGWGGPTRQSWDALEPIQGARLNGESGPAALSLAGLRSSVIGGYRNGSRAGQHRRLRHPRTGPDRARRRDPPTGMDPRPRFGELHAIERRHQRRAGLVLPRGKVGPRERPATAPPRPLKNLAPR